MSTLLTALAVVSVVAWFGGAAVFALQWVIRWLSGGGRSPNPMSGYIALAGLLGTLIAVALRKWLGQ